MDSMEHGVEKSGRSVKRDPVFLFMVGALLLAMGSVLALRAVIGPAPAQAAARDVQTDTETPSMTYLPPANTSHAHLVSASK